MPLIRREALPRDLWARLLARIQSRHITVDQLALLADWLAAGGLTSYNPFIDGRRLADAAHRSNQPRTSGAGRSAPGGQRISLALDAASRINDARRNPPPPPTPPECPRFPRLDCCVAWLPLQYHQFARSANHRQGKSHRGAHPCQSPGNHRVVDVPAVPSQEEVHFMHRGKSDVCRIPRRSFGNQPRGQNPPRQRLHLVADRQYGHGGDGVETQPRSLGIALRRLSQNFWRHEQFEMRSPGIPPFPGGELLRGNFHVPTRPGGQQAWNRRFEINFWLHFTAHAQTIPSAHGRWRIPFGGRILVHSTGRANPIHRKDDGAESNHV